MISPTTLPTPPAYFPNEVTELVRSVAAEAEAQCCLHIQQLNAIYSGKWFKLFIPLEKGGLGLSLPAALQLEEALARVDGSTAWVVTLCAGAGWFIGFLHPSVAQEFFSDSRICIAGSGDISGYAERTNRGYMINGTWRYASGSLHATAFTANCQLTKDKELQYHEDGTPKIATFIFKSTEVVVLPTWDMLGMVATASHSFEVRHLELGPERLFRVDPEQAVLPDPIYRYPFLQLAETTLAVNLSGMALRFAELASEVLNGELSKKSNEESLSVLERSILKLEAARLNFYNVVSTSWEQLQANQSIAEGGLQNTSIASQALARTARSFVNDVYPLCGLTAAKRDSEINRVWRNIHTAGQHTLLN